MEKEELLSRLRTLEGSLPSELIETEHAKEVMEKSGKYFQKCLNRLEDIELRENNYDEVLLNDKESERESFLLERESIKTSINESETEVEILTQEIEDMEKRLVSRFDTRINKYEEIIAGFDTQLANSLTEYEREYINNKKEKRTAELDELRGYRSNFVNNLNRKKERLESVKARIEEKQRELQAVVLEISSVNTQINEIINTNSISEEDMQRYELDTEALYRLSRYFNANPKEEINRIISDFENGSINEEQVNNRLQDLNALLTSGLYDISEVKANLSPEQILENRRKAEEEIQVLEEKLADDSVYQQKTNEYDENLDRIVAYNEMIEDIREEQNRKEAMRRKDSQEIISNEEKISRYESWIESGEKNIEIIKYAPIPEEEKESVIKKVQFKNESYAASIESLKNKNARLKSKESDYESSKYVAQVRIDKYNEKIEACRSKLYELNTSERSKDVEHLEELEAVLLATHLPLKVFENSFESELNNLIDLTGGISLKEEGGKVVPSLVSKFNDEQKEVYDKLLSDLNPEDRKKVEETIKKRVADLPIVEDSYDVKEDKKVCTKNSKRDTDLPILEDSYDLEKDSKVAKVPNGPKVKVRKFKDLSKEKWNKITDYVKKHWKRLATEAALIGVGVAMLFSINCNKVKDSNVVREPVVVEINLKNPEPERIEIQLKEEDDLDDSIEDIEFPEIDSPDVPTNPIVPDPTPEPLQPDPGVDPTPTPEPDPEDEEETYYMEDGLPEGTGNSAPADPDVPFIDGTSVHYHDEKTGAEVYITPDGTKITVNPDGTYVVEHQEEEVEEVEDGVKSVTDPDMSPAESEEVEKPQTPEGEELEAPKSYDEAVEDGTLSGPESEEYQDFFEDFFNGLSEEEKGRAR